MAKCVVFLLVLVSVAAAQVGGITRVQPVSASLVQYLELTPQQAAAISQLNSTYMNFNMQKAQRGGQVQAEIAQETAKPTLDAMALGLRYLELEAIRREMNSEREKTVAAVQNILTAPQKAKLTALQQALSMYSTACEAVSYNLFTPQPDRWFNTSGFASFLLGDVISFPNVLPSGCGTTGVRTGDFSSTPVFTPSLPTP